MLASHADIKYWTSHNVTNHCQFSSIEESLRYLRWRNAQYVNYARLMDVSGYDNKVVLDYGCGPGHDLVGLGVYSNPEKLYGLDVSKSSLAEARSRLALHNINAELMMIDTSSNRLSFEDNSIDYIHCSGVLHHIPNHLATLNEFQRILKPNGVIKVMVYNYNSIWLHLYVAYVTQIIGNLHTDKEIRVAFSKTTDGPSCPTSFVYKPSEFVDICAQANLNCKFIGAAVSVFELSLLPKRFEAIMNINLPEEHRDFLSALTFDQFGCPVYEGEIAGIDACYEITKV